MTLNDTVTPEVKTGISRQQARVKRIFDFVLATIGLLLSGWLIVLAWIVASLETKSNGLFIQKRIGMNGKPFNVFKSFVGPRPDVPGYADKLVGSDRRILDIRPGITGPATLAYRNEEEILANVSNPIQYNDDIIFPHKVRLNVEYIESYSFKRDIKYILATVLGNEVKD